MNLSMKACLKIAGSIFLLYLAIHYWPAVSNLLGALLGAASPLLLGCALAYIVNILMSFYERTLLQDSTNPVLGKIRRPICMVLAFVSLLAIIALVIVLIVPQLVDCVELLIAQLPGAIRSCIAYLDTLPFLSDDLMNTLNEIDWQSKITEIVNVLSSGLGSVMDVVISTVTSVLSGIVTAFMSIIFSVYLLTGRDRLQAQSKRLLQHIMKPQHYEKLMYVLAVLNNSFHRYITGQCIEAVILGSLCAAGMLILRLPYPTMIGALMAFTALIPVAGAYIGAGIGAFMIVMVSPVKALIFLIFIVVLLQVEGNIIYPKVVGSSLGLPGIWVLAAVTIGGGVMGITGMLIGVPLAATAYRLLQENVNKPATLSGGEKNATGLTAEKGDIS